MKFRKTFLAALLVGAVLAGSPPLRAQSELSALSALSALPVASVVIAGESAAAATQASVVLVAAGATLVVRAVQSTARGTVYVLERVSDGVRLSVEVSGKVAGAASVAVGTAVTVSVIAAGTLLIVAGEVIAFVPNAVGQALLYNRRLGN